MPIRPPRASLSRSRETEPANQCGLSTREPEQPRIGDRTPEELALNAARFRRANDRLQLAADGMGLLGKVPLHLRVRRRHLP